MRFSLIDKIVELKPGQSILAQKTLQGSEDYLKDHFPNFPCMPGVLMLEAMYQAGSWLLRQTDDFARPIVLMKEVRNVKYGSFVEPGQTLTVNVQVMKQVDDHTTKMKGQGTVEGKSAVSGVMLLDQFRLAERYGSAESLDLVSRREYLTKFAELYQPAMETV